MRTFSISEWGRGEASEADLEMLGEVLHSCVEAGASVSFVMPFSMEEARAFWRDSVLPEILGGRRRVLVARSGEKIVGTVQVVLATPPNQRHRAEILKLLVHAEARRGGIGRALMAAAEELARAEGRTLLTLDTRTGDKAEPLYRSMGYVVAGVIPRYARGPGTAELEATSILYKELM